MKKTFMLSVVFLASVYGAYNPFFTDLTQQKEKAKVVTKVVEIEPRKPLPPREEIDIVYLGYIESNKGKFALITFDGHNIVVRQNDSLYSGAKVFRVQQISTNFIVMQDTNFRNQTIFFSSNNGEVNR